MKDILENLNKIVQETFRHSDRDIKDGMDMALCSLHLQTNILEFSGANNPLWIICRDGTVIARYFNPDYRDRASVQWMPEHLPE